MAHEDIEVDFSNSNGDLAEQMVCLVGPNGTGKTTILHAIQIMFNNYNGWDKKRFRSGMLKYVRNFQAMSPEQLRKADFYIKGVFECDDEDGEYEVIVRRMGIVKWHPSFISKRLHNYCYFARFDQELGIFQISRPKWPNFQKLYKAVTGFEIVEAINPFDGSSSDPSDTSQIADRRAAARQKEYVTSIEVLNKGDDVFTNRGFSAGERKIAKCFSTIYNLEVAPQIIMVDNVTDHVELDRHLPLLSAMEECFPESQLICTCHSNPVQRNFDKQKIVDLRYIKVPNRVWEEPFRLKLMDEVNNVIDKVKYAHLNDPELQEQLKQWKKGVEDKLLRSDNAIEHVDEIKGFIGHLFKKYIVDDIVSEPKPRIKTR